jgi:hypothetical protein
MQFRTGITDYGTWHRKKLPDNFSKKVTLIYKFGKNYSKYKNCFKNRNNLKKNHLKIIDIQMLICYNEHGKQWHGVEHIPGLSILCGILRKKRRRSWNE